MSNDPFADHALIFTGPGSQPGDEDGAELDFLPMPSGMVAFATPILPEPEEIAGGEAAIAALDRVLEGLKSLDASGPTRRFDVTDLDPANRELLDQILGEGDVSALAGDTIQVQESVMAGIWRVRVTDPNGGLVADTIEIGAFPDTALKLAFPDSAAAIDTSGELPAGVINAPALLTELNDQIAARAEAANAMPHVINLTLLPHTEEDLTYLDERLGRGPVLILSRGYGNCRIQATATRNVWWVRYYNSDDALILNTIEVTDVPNVSCAAQEDLDDSATRLSEILDVYR